MALSVSFSDSFPASKAACGGCSGTFAEWEAAERGTRLNATLVPTLGQTDAAGGNRTEEDRVGRFEATDSCADVISYGEEQQKASRLERGSNLNSPGA